MKQLDARIKAENIIAKVLKPALSELKTEIADRLMAAHEKGQQDLQAKIDFENSDELFLD